MAAGGFSLRHLFIVDDSQKAKSDPEADINALLSDALHPSTQPGGSSRAQAPAKPAQAAASVSGDQSLVLTEGVELGAIYSAAGIASVTFSIEKLAKLIEGLNQLDAATKKTAVAAMDAADDSWDIATVIADGKAKRAALAAYQSEVSSSESAISTEISRRLDANQAEKAAHLAEIDQQIAELQSKREETIAQAANAAASLRSQGAAAAEAGERERNRISNAIRGFDGLIGLFDVTPPSPSA